MTSQALRPWIGWIVLALFAALLAVHCQTQAASSSTTPGANDDAWTSMLDATMAEERWLSAELYDDARARNRVRVFVHLQLAARPESELSPGDIGEQQDRIAEAQAEFLRFDTDSVKGAPTRFATVPLLSLTLDDRRWTSLVEHVAVAGAEVTGLGGTSVGYHLTKVPLLGIQSAARCVGCADITVEELREDVHSNGLSVDGTAQTVVVIDNGVRDDGVVPGLVGRITGGDWLVQGDTVCMDDPQLADLPPNDGIPGVVEDYVLNHGTQVAALVAAIAPAVSIVSIRVDEGGPQIPLDNVIAALERVRCVWLKRDPAIAAVCLALGDDGASGPHLVGCARTPENSEFALAMQNLVDDGVTVVLPAGNDGVYGAVSFPGCMDPGLTVGGTVPWKLTSASTRVRAGFSNWGPLVELAAPAMMIGLPVDWSTYLYTVEKGTSVSVPIVAGAIALARQAHPTATARELEAAFVGTGAEAHDEARITASPTLPDVAVPFVQVTEALDALAGN